MISLSSKSRPNSVGNSVGLNHPNSTNYRSPLLNRNIKKSQRISQYWLNFGDTEDSSLGCLGCPPPTLFLLKVSLRKNPSFHGMLIVTVSPVTCQQVCQPITAESPPAGPLDSTVHREGHQNKCYDNSVPSNQTGTNRSTSGYGFLGDFLDRMVITFKGVFLWLPNVRLGTLLMKHNNISKKINQKKKTIKKTYILQQLQSQNSSRHHKYHTIFWHIQPSHTTVDGWNPVPP